MRFRSHQLNRVSNNTKSGATNLMLRLKFLQIFFGKLCVSTLFCLAFLPIHVAAEEIKAGFDCKKASTNLESYICSKPSVARHDLLLSDLFSTIRDALPDSKKEEFIRQQKAWVLKRNSDFKNLKIKEDNIDLAYSNREKLESFYLDRIKTFLRDHDAILLNYFKNSLANQTQINKSFIGTYVWNKLGANNLKEISTLSAFLKGQDENFLFLINSTPIVFNSKNDTFKKIEVSHTTGGSNEEISPKIIVNTTNWSAFTFADEKKQTINYAIPSSLHRDDTKAGRVYVYQWQGNLLKLTKIYRQPILTELQDIDESKAIVEYEYNPNNEKQNNMQNASIEIRNGGCFNGICLKGKFTKAELEKYLDAKITGGRGEDIYLSMFPEKYVDGIEPYLQIKHRTITCNEFASHTVSEFCKDTPSCNDAHYVDVTCKNIKLLLKSDPPKQSFISNPKITVSMLELIPALDYLYLENLAGDLSEETKQSYKDKTVKDLVQEGKLTLEKRNDFSFTVADKKYRSSTSITEIARGDFSKSGTEEILASYYHDTGGTMSLQRLVLLRKLKDNAKFELIEADAFFK